MLYTIYKVTNILNNKKYIGKHITENIDDSYLGSGNLLRKAVTKYGTSNFKKEILFVFDNETAMNEKEKELIDLIIVKSPEYYNISLGGKGGVTVLKKDHPLFTKTCSKMSKIRLDKSEEISEHVKKLHKEKRVGMYGRRQSDNQKQKVSEALKGRKFTDKHKQKVSESLRKLPKFECEFCGIKTNKGNYRRWHGQACRKNIY